MEIVNINGKNYYAGLNWQTDDRDAKSILKDYRVEYKGRGYYCKRGIAGLLNIGYSQEPAGKYKKIPSLAAAVANGKTEPWIGIFKIGEDRYYYVAIRDNQAVIPGGDFIGTKKDISEIVKQHSVYKWDIIIEDGDKNTLAELISEGNEKAYVLPLHNKINYFSAAVVLLLILTAGLFLYKEKQKRQLQKIAPVFKPKKLPPPLPIYISFPAAGQVIKGCYKTLLALPISYNGWKPVSLECGQTGYVITYKKESFGNILDAPKGIIGNGGTTIISDIPAHYGNPGKPCALWSKQKIEKYLYGYSDITGLHLELGILSMNRPPMSRRPNSYAQTANSASFTATGINMKYLELFTLVPSLIVKSIKITGLPVNYTITATGEVWWK